MNGELAGKVVLVTGATRGIGLVTVQNLARSGAYVIATGRDKAACDNVVGRIEQDGGQAFACEMDVVDPDSVATAFRRILRRTGRIDALVNNAGTIEPLAMIDECTPDQWHTAIATNLLGPFYTCRLAISAMLRIGQGVIVNVGSSAARAPVAGMSAYCASKAGLGMLTASLHAEYGHRGIRVFGLLPGRTDTYMHEVLRRTRINSLADIAPSELADPEIPARVVAQLCTDAAAHLAGEEIELPSDLPRMGLKMP